jgi:Cu(I)/Ag(I) efflux system membrane fusion protein
MKSKIRVVVLLVIAFTVGVLLGPRLLQDAGDPAEGGGETTTEREILYWVAPMDPNFRRDEPGKSPMGMDLVPVYADSAPAGDAVTIDPAVVNNLGVRTEEAQVRPLWRRIEATGYVGFDETQIAHINTRVAGWIVRLGVGAEGERVMEGDLLFELYSPELVNAQKEYLQALARGDKRLLSGAREKLRALGMIPSEVDALSRRGSASENIRIVAPQDGVVATLGVREGMYVQPNTPIMSLADLETVWLQAEVFESQAEWVAAGQAAEARLEYMPGSVFSGQVDYVYPVLDPVTRTLRVRLRFENSEERLKPNMYARVSIYGKLKPNALSIPREALIPAPGRDRVVVALGDGKFSVREVLTGLESGSWVEILAGLEKGEEVVTSSQFLIDSEASLAGSIQRLEAVEERPEEPSPMPVYASGQVEQVDAQRRQVQIAHGPIEALAWPPMTMIFDVRPQVALEGVRAGQGIRFALEQEDAGQYVVSEIFTGENGADEMSEVSPDDHEGHGGHMGRTPEPAQPSERRIMAGAVVRDVMPSEHKLRLAHDPIPELDWPSMTMNFRVQETVSIDHLSVGQSIHFSMVEQDGAWVIDQIHVMDGEMGDGEHQHD